LKIISTCLLVCLLVNQAAGAIPENSISANSPAKISIPLSLGTVQESFVPAMSPDLWKGRLLIHIQDAHGVPEAQENIEALLDYLASHYGMNRLYLEGAVGRLEPERFHFFSRERNEKVWQKLFSDAVLSGAELYLLRKGRPGIASGVEEEAPYAENLRLFRKVMASAGASGEWTQTLYGRLDLAASRILKPGTREIFRKWWNFEDQHAGLLDFIKLLLKNSGQGADFETKPWKYQAAWPHLSRLIALQSLEHEFDFEKIAHEKEDFLKQLKNEKIDPALIAQLEKRTREEAKDFKNSGSRALFEKIFEALGDRKLSLSSFPHFLKWARYQILSEEIKAVELEEETERFARETVSGQAETPDQKNILKLFCRLLLLKKTFKLELSRKEWARVQKDRKMLNPVLISKNLKQLLAGKRDVAPLALDYFEKAGAVLDQAIDFYEKAVQRDSILIHHTLEDMEKNRAEKAVLITGGFHGEGIKEILKQKGIAYVQITPAMGGEISPRAYVNRMMHGLTGPAAKAAFSHLAIPAALQQEAVLRRLREWDYIQARVAEATSRTGRKAPKDEAVPHSSQKAASMGNPVDFIFNPQAPDEQIVSWLKEVRFGEPFETGAMQVVLPDLEQRFVLKSVRLASPSIGENDQQRFISHWLTKALYEWARFHMKGYLGYWLKEQGKRLLVELGWIGPRAPPRFTNGYQIAARHLSVHPVRFRTISLPNPALLRGLPFSVRFMAQKNAPWIIQDYVPEEWFIQQRVKQAVEAQEMTRAEFLVRGAIQHVVSLWRQNLVDTDGGINIFENIALTDQRIYDLVDWEAVTDNETEILAFLKIKQEQMAEIVFAKAQHGSLERTLLALEKNIMARMALRFYDFLPHPAAERMAEVFLEEIGKNFTVENWQRVRTESNTAASLGKGEEELPDLETSELTARLAYDIHTPSKARLQQDFELWMRLFKPVELQINIYNGADRIVEANPEEVFVGMGTAKDTSLKIVITGRMDVDALDTIAQQVRRLLEDKTFGSYAGNEELAEDVFDEITDIAEELGLEGASLGDEPEQLKAKEIHHLKFSQVGIEFVNGLNSVTTVTPGEEVTVRIKVPVSLRDKIQTPKVITDLPGQNDRPFEKESADADGYDIWAVRLRAEQTGGYYYMPYVELQYDHKTEIFWAGNELDNPAIRVLPKWATQGLNTAIVFIKTLRRPGTDQNRFGTFTDLKWYLKELKFNPDPAKRIDLNAVLLLPFTDSFGDSPYEAISPYAIHPKHIDWDEVAYKSGKKSLQAKEDKFKWFKKYAAKKDREFQAFLNSPLFEKLWEYADVKAILTLRGPQDGPAQDPAIRAKPEYHELVGSRENRQDFGFFIYEQYIALKQLKEAVKYIDKKLGIRLGFDIPFYPSDKGALAFHHPEDFIWEAFSDEHGHMHKRIQAPRYQKGHPAHHQIWWGQGLWNYEKLRELDYEPILAPFRYWRDMGFFMGRWDAAHMAPHELHWKMNEKILRGSDFLLIPEQLGGTVDGPDNDRLNLLKNGGLLYHNPEYETAKGYDGLVGTAIWHKDDYYFRVSSTHDSPRMIYIYRNIGGLSNSMEEERLKMMAIHRELAFLQEGYTFVQGDERGHGGPYQDDMRINIPLNAEEIAKGRKEWHWDTDSPMQTERYDLRSHIGNLMRIRKEHSVLRKPRTLHYLNNSQWGKVSSFLRLSEEEAILVVNNLSGLTQKGEVFFSDKNEDFLSMEKLGIPSNRPFTVINLETREEMEFKPANHVLPFELKPGQAYVFDLKKIRTAAASLEEDFLYPSLVRSIPEFISFDSYGKPALYAGGRNTHFGDQEWGRDFAISMIGIDEMARNGEWIDFPEGRRLAKDIAKDLIRRWAGVDPEGRAGMDPHDRRRINPWHSSGDIMYNVINWYGDYNRNTVDAPLWFVEAVFQYVDATGDTDLLNEKMRDGLPLLQILGDIIDRYAMSQDEDFRQRKIEPQSIRMDEKTGFILVPRKKYTWMDTPFTERQGYPVEIQALWFNALNRFADLAEKANLSRSAQVLKVRELAGKVEKNFPEYFWNWEGKYLYDILGTDGGMTADESIKRGWRDPANKPNQLFAVYFGLVKGEKARDILQAIERELLIPGALRSLSPRNAGYRHDFQVAERDGLDKNAAYHSGMGWVWLYPFYYMAAVDQGMIRPDEAEAKIKEDLEPIVAHNPRHSLPELLSGNAYNGIHARRGPDVQSWSVMSAIAALRKIKSKQATAASLGVQYRGNANGIESALRESLGGNHYGRVKDIQLMAEVLHRTLLAMEPAHLNNEARVKQAIGAAFDGEGRARLFNGGLDRVETYSFVSAVYKVLADHGILSRDRKITLARHYGKVQAVPFVELDDQERIEQAIKILQAVGNVTSFSPVAATAALQQDEDAFSSQNWIFGKLHGIVLIHTPAIEEGMARFSFFEKPKWVPVTLLVHDKETGQLAEKHPGLKLSRDGTEIIFMPDPGKAEGFAIDETGHARHVRAVKASGQSLGATEYFLKNVLKIDISRLPLRDQEFSDHSFPITAENRQALENTFRNNNAQIEAKKKFRVFFSGKTPYAMGLEKEKIYVSLAPTELGYFGSRSFYEPHRPPLFEAQLLQSGYWAARQFGSDGNGMKGKHLVFSRNGSALVDEDVIVFPGVYHPWNDRSSQAMIEAMTDEIKPGMKVYIVGLGSGFDARYAARLGASVQGVDLNGAALPNTFFNFESAPDAAILFPRLSKATHAPMFEDLTEGKDFFDRIFFNMPSDDSERQSQYHFAFRDPGWAILRSFLLNSPKFLKPDGKVVFVHGTPQAVRQKARQLEIDIQERQASNGYAIFKTTFTNLQAASLGSEQGPAGVRYVPDPRAREKLDRALAIKYRAEVDDIDGNLTASGTSEVTNLVMSEIQRSVQRGIPRGLASGRAEKTTDKLRQLSVHDIEEVAERVRSGLSRDEMPKFIIFPENGSYAVWYEWDTAAGGFVRKEVDLAKHFGKVPPGFEFTESDRTELYDGISALFKGQYENPFTLREDKRYGLAAWAQQAGLPPAEISRRANEMAKRIQEFLDHHPNPKFHMFEALGTSVSVDLMVKGVNKLLAVKFMAEKFGIPENEVVATDDKAAKNGNGWALTNRPGGFSTNESDPESQDQVALKLAIGAQGLDAWTFLQRHLQWALPGGASLGDERNQPTSILLPKFGEVLVPAEYRDVVAGRAPPMVRRADADFQKILALIAAGTVIVLTGQYAEVRRTYNLLASHQNELIKAGQFAAIPALLDRRRAEQSAKRSFLLRLMMVARHDSLLKIFQQPELGNLAQKFSIHGAVMDGQPFLVPVKTILGMEATSQRLKQGFYIPALDKRITVFPEVLVPADHRATTLIAKNLVLKDGDMVLDMGSGTGVLALIAAQKARRQGLKNVKIYATDLNSQAVENIHANVERFGYQDLIEVRGPGSLFDTVQGLKFDVILFNPPWLPGDPKRLLDHAIYDKDFAVITQFLAEARDYLKEGGRILLEYSDYSDLMGHPALENLNRLIETNHLTIARKKFMPPQTPTGAPRTDKKAKSAAKQTLFLYDIRATRGASLGDEAGVRPFLEAEAEANECIRIFQTPGLKDGKYQTAGAKLFEIAEQDQDRQRNKQPRVMTRAKVDLLNDILLNPGREPAVWQAAVRVVYGVWCSQFDHSEETYPITRRTVDGLIETFKRQGLGTSAYEALIDTLSLLTGFADETSDLGNYMREQFNHAIETAELDPAIHKLMLKRGSGSLAFVLEQILFESVCRYIARILKTPGTSPVIYRGVLEYLEQHIWWAFKPPPPDVLLSAFEEFLRSDRAGPKEAKMIARIEDHIADRQVHALRESKPDTVAEGWGTAIGGIIGPAARWAGKIKSLFPGLEESAMSPAELLENFYGRGTIILPVKNGTLIRFERTDKDSAIYIRAYDLQTGQQVGKVLFESKRFNGKRFAVEDVDPADIRFDGSSLDRENIMYAGPAIEVDPNYQRKGIGILLQLLNFYVAKRRGFETFDIHRITALPTLLPLLEKLAMEMGFQMERIGSLNRRIDLTEIELPRFAEQLGRLISRPEASSLGQEFTNSEAIKLLYTALTEPLPDFVLHNRPHLIRFLAEKAGLDPNLPIGEQYQALSATTPDANQHRQTLAARLTQEGAITNKGKWQPAKLPDSVRLDLAKKDQKSEREYLSFIRVINNMEKGRLIPLYFLIPAAVLNIGFWFGVGTLLYFLGYKITGFLVGGILGMGAIIFTPGSIRRLQAKQADLVRSAIEHRSDRQFREIHKGDEVGYIPDRSKPEQEVIARVTKKYTITHEGLKFQVLDLEWTQDGARKKEAEIPVAFVRLIPADLRIRASSLGTAEAILKVLEIYGKLQQMATQGPIDVEDLERDFNELLRDPVARGFYRQRLQSISPGIVDPQGTDIVSHATFEDRGAVERFLSDLKDLLDRLMEESGRETGHFVQLAGEISRDAQRLLIGTKIFNDFSRRFPHPPIVNLSFEPLDRATVRQFLAEIKKELANLYRLGVDIGRIAEVAREISFLELMMDSTQLSVQRSRVSSIVEKIRALVLDQQGPSGASLGDEAIWNEYFQLDETQSLLTPGDLKVIMPYWTDIFQKETQPVKALDFGAGKFILTREMQRILPQGSEIHAIDVVDPQNLKIPQGIHYHQKGGEVLDQEFPESTFDLIVGMFALEYSDIKESLRALHKISRSGARLRVLMHQKGSPYAQKAESALRQGKIVADSNIFGTMREFLKNPTPITKEKSYDAVRSFLDVLDRRQRKSKDVDELLKIQSLMRQVEARSDTNPQAALEYLNREVKKYKNYLEVMRLLSEKAAVYGNKDEAILRHLFQDAGFEVQILRPFTRQNVTIGWQVEALARSQSTISDGAGFGQGASLGAENENHRLASGREIPKSLPDELSLFFISAEDLRREDSFGIRVYKNGTAAMTDEEFAAMDYDDLTSAVDDSQFHDYRIRLDDQNNLFVEHEPRKEAGIPVRWAMPAYPEAFHLVVFDIATARQNWRRIHEIVGIVQDWDDQDPVVLSSYTERDIRKLKIELSQLRGDILSIQDDTADKHHGFLVRRLDPDPDIVFEIFYTPSGAGFSQSPSESEGASLGNQAEKKVMTDIGLGQVLGGPYTDVNGALVQNVAVEVEGGPEIPYTRMLKGYDPGNLARAQRGFVFNQELFRDVMGAEFWPGIFEKIFPDGKVLDLGSATGRHFSGLGEQELSRITAFDYMQSFLTEIQQRFPSIHVQQGDWTDMKDFPAQSFEAVTGLNALTYTHSEEELRQALKEIDRVLKPSPDGKKLFVHLTDRDPMPGEWYGPGYEDALKHSDLPLAPLGSPEWFMLRSPFSLRARQNFLQTLTRLLENEFGYRVEPVHLIRSKIVKATPAHAALQRQMPLANVFIDDPSAGVLFGNDESLPPGYVKEQIELYGIRAEKKAASLGKEELSPQALAGHLRALTGDVLTRAEAMTVIFVAGGFVRPDYPKNVIRIFAQSLEPVLALLEGGIYQPVSVDRAIEAANQDIHWILNRPLFIQRGVKPVSSRDASRNLAVLLDMEVLAHSTTDQIKRLADGLKQGDLVMALWNGEGKGAGNRQKPRALSNLIKILSPKGIRVADIFSQHPSSEEMKRGIPPRYDQGILISKAKSVYGDLQVSIETDRFRFDTDKLLQAGLDPNQAVALLRQIAEVPDKAKRFELYSTVLGVASFDAASNSWLVGANLVDFIKRISAADDATKTLGRAA